LRGERGWISFHFFNLDFKTHSLSEDRANFTFCFYDVLIIGKFMTGWNLE
jgi:hypothetical protein